MKLELGITVPEPEVSPAEIEALVRVLFDAGTWLTAAEIAAKVGGVSDRFVRKVASAACPAVVSYPGSPGYKLWNLCTVEEINHAIDAIESQAKDMLKRAVLYRQAYHKRFRGAPGGPIAHPLL